MFGYSCCNGGWVGTHCKNSIEMKPDESRDEFENRAGKEGWVIGHLDGQGHFACPDCKDDLNDPMPLRST